MSHELGFGESSRSGSSDWRAVTSPVSSRWGSSGDHGSSGDYDGPRLPALAEDMPVGEAARQGSRAEPEEEASPPARSLERALVPGGEAARETEEGGAGRSEEGRPRLSAGD